MAGRPLGAGHLHRAALWIAAQRSRSTIALHPGIFPPTSGLTYIGASRAPAGVVP